MKTVRSFNSIERKAIETQEQKAYKARQRALAETQKAIAAKKAAKTAAKAAKKVQKILSNNAKVDLGGSMNNRELVGAPKAPKSLDFSKDEIFNLADAGLLTDENGNLVGFSVEQLKDMEERQKETYVNTARSFLEANGVNEEINLEELDDEVITLMYEQLLDNREKTAGFNRTYSEPQIVLQTSFCNLEGKLCWKTIKRITLSEYDLDNLDHITEVAGAKSYPIDSFFEMRGRIVRSVKTEALKELLVSEGVTIGTKIVTKKDGDSVEQYDTEAFFYTSTFSYTDKYGQEKEGTSTDQVRVIIEMSNVNEVEDENGHDIGFAEFFNLNTQTISCRRSEDPCVTLFIPARKMSKNEVFKRLKAGEFTKVKEKMTEPKVIGYKVVGLRGVRPEGEKKYFAVERLENMTKCMYGYAYTPVAVTPIVRREKVVTEEVVNTVYLYTPKSTNPTERFFVAREEAIAMVNSDMWICFRRNTSEISNLAALRQEDNDLIQVGRAHTHVPSWLASLDGAWEERKTMIESERLTEFYAKKTSAAIKGREASKKKYYDNFLKEHEEIVKLLPALNSKEVDLEAMELFIKRKDLDPVIVYRVAVAVKKKTGVAPFSINKFLFLRNMAKGQKPVITPVTKAGTKRKEYSNIQKLIFSLNDSRESTAILKQLKGKTAKIQKILAVAEQELRQSQADRAEAAKLRAAGHQVDRVLSKDYAILKREVFFHLKKMVA